MAEQVATASPAGPKKKRRMGVSEGFKIEFAVDQMIAMLKAEAQSVKFKGIASFLDDKGEVVMDSIQPYLNSHLSVLTNASYPDCDGAEHAEENQTTIDNFESKIRSTGTNSFAPALGRRPSPPPPRFAFTFTATSLLNFVATPPIWAQTVRL